MRYLHGHIKEKGVLQKMLLLGSKLHKVLWSSNAKARFISKDGLMGYKVSFVKSAAMKRVNALWDF